MNLKVFQCAILTIALSASLLAGLNGCSTAEPATSTPQMRQEDFVVISSLSENHGHSIIVKWEDINKANINVVYTSTVNGTPSHSHKVVISDLNFKDIKAGKTITVKSNPPIPDVIVVSNHTHEFVIKR